MNAPSGRLAGKAGVITGAADGLGRAVLLHAASEEARLVALDRDGERLEATVREATDAGGTVITHVGDVTREADVAGAAERCVETFGTLNLFDNNAAVAFEASIHETTVEQWREVIEVNLTGAFFGCKHAVLAMREHGGGSIVNTGSIASLGGDPMLAAYSTTKAGLLGLTRAVAMDYADDGIRCNAVCPGDMLTPMLERSLDRNPGLRATMEAAYPDHRIADPAEAAAAVVFLLSDEASYVNGSSLVVDGGLTVKLY